MTINIPTWFAPTFKTNVSHLLQQKDSRIVPTFEAGSYTGDSGAPVNQLGAAVANKKETRGEDTKLYDLVHDRRWVYPTDYEWATLLDTEDKLRSITDPTSDYAEAARMAMKRARDDEAIGAFFADAKVGRKAENTETWDTANQQIAAGGAGMTVAKLRAAKQKLLAAEVDVDNDPLFCAISAKEHDGLLADIQVTNRDYNGGMPVLKDGKIDYFMGFRFLHSERLQTSGANRRCPAWAKSGMHFGTWNDLFVDIGPRRDKSGAIQVLAKGTYGATRLEMKKVVEILCA